MSIKINQNQDLEEINSWESSEERKGKTSKEIINPQIIRAKKKRKSNKKLKSYDKSICTLERKFWFNEKKLKEILIKFEVPLSFKNMRIIKEHASSTNKEVVDLSPAFDLIKEGLPK